MSMKQTSFTLKSDDRFAEAHTEAVNAGVFVKVDKNGRTLTVLGSMEQVRAISQKIAEIKNGGDEPPAEDSDDELPAEDSDDELPAPPAAPES